MKHINIVESTDTDFNLSIASTTVTIFMKYYKQYGTVEKAMNCIEKNPILNIRGTVKAINELQGMKKIPQELVAEINEKYIHKLI